MLRYIIMAQNATIAAASQAAEITQGESQNTNVTTQSARGADRKRRRLAEAELRESTERALTAYVEPLVNVTAFKYLGRVLTARDDNWPAVVGNISNARNSWERLSRTLIREGADPKVSGIFKKRC